jgi:hypothetical protein
MSVKTRYFVIVSLLIMGVGLGTGLVAYYVGFPATAFFSKNGPEELRYMPSTATVVGAVEVREIMASDLRRRLKEKFGSDAQDNSRREFQELTGINFETDIERIVACFDSHSSADNTALVLARGTFDATRIEALMREHGAEVQDYKGKRLILARKLFPDDRADNGFGNDSNDADIKPRTLTAHNANMALTFIEPGLVAFGGRPLVEQAIDLHTGGGSSAATNDDLIAHVRGLEGSNAWIVGRLDAIRERARLPEIVANQIPPITWFTIRGQIDGGVAARITAEAKDDESANQLRDVVRGFLALAKLQTSSKPEFQRFVQSLQLGGTGTTVSLAVDVPPQVFDALGAIVPKQKP